MKKAGLLIILVSICGFAFSQDLSKFNIYHPEEDAEAGIAEAVKKARAENKHVFIQAGGNWCIWCARFNDLATTDVSIDSMVQANYVVYHLNYSKENKNEKVLARFGYPQRFGFPVFIILDGEGNRLHTQNSGYLEQDKGYNRKAVLGFLADWSPAALDSNQYR